MPIVFALAPCGCRYRLVVEVNADWLKFIT